MHFYRHTLKSPPWRISTLTWWWTPVAVHQRITNVHGSTQTNLLLAQSRIKKKYFFFEQKT